MKFIKRNDVIHVCDLLLTELMLTLRVNSQRMVIPDQRSDEHGIPSTLIEAVLRPQQNYATRRWMEIQRAERLDDEQCLLRCTDQSVNIVKTLIFLLGKHC